jgi:hypothetical protein
MPTDRFLGRTRAALASVTASRDARPDPRTADPAGVADRQAWVTMAQRLADPVLGNLAAGKLRARMPIEQAPDAGRATSSHLEAFARLLSGIAPWLELEPDETEEGRLRAHYRELALAALREGLDPDSPDAMDFAHGTQPLVEAAYLGLAILRAPRLMGRLDPASKERLVRGLEATRRILPHFNNWLLFSGTVEIALEHLGAWRDSTRVDYALHQHWQWYAGDATYGDGPESHWDYYNSFVIHPMLDEILDVVGEETGPWLSLRDRQRERAGRYAVILERLIGPDGTFPPIGRSLAYRVGAFHALARTALHRSLPDELDPAQVRGALTAAIGRSLGSPGTFDDAGWLRIGLAGHQPGIGESYISTGSLYLCAQVLLPLGLPPDDRFWTRPAVPWTAQRAWSGSAFPIDKALETRGRKKQP